MTPEYLEQLADLADPEQLWRRGGLLDRRILPAQQRQQLDTGVALRRYADHLRTVRKALAEQRSVLITPISTNGTRVSITATPPAHASARRQLGPQAAAASTERDCCGTLPGSRHRASCPNSRHRKG